jgi:acyl transferase domain-containing protein/acyl carrier protein
MDARTDAGSRRDVIERAFTLIKQLERRLAVAERAAAEPVAIVGMDCRFPGPSNDPEAYWRVLERGVDATRPFPRDRGGAAGTAFGAFLDDIDQFDAGFFGITPREARMLDPQQRLLLETSWRALEHAGQAPDQLSGTRTGVFVGITMLDYGRVLEDSAPAVTDVYAATGNALNTAAGRVSFVLGLQGPCLSIDTACSSSLVAIHTACRSLRARDCELALAGGVNVILRQHWSDLLSSWGLMAADGRCKTFDASADGFVRSEGCGMLVLRRLSDAEARGDRILAVILGSAVNHDGHSSGLTVPNGLSQQALIRAALADAGVSSDAVDYVEAHGTGTPVGDPIEVEALAQELAQGRSAHRPLLIGSVKTNIGHPESASGVAGLMKVVLGLQHQAIPAHLHFRTPSPAIPWSLAPIRVVTETTAWPQTPGRRRIAGISSFGFSGTNAHVIVAEAPRAEGMVARRATAPVQVLTMSARHPASLRELAAEYAKRLPGLEAPDWAAVCYSANTGRARMAERIAVAARSPESMASALESWLREGAAPGLFHATCRPSHAPKVAFLFTGQGSQYAGMGRQLYERHAVVRAAIDDCAQRLAPHMDRPLLEVMFGAEPGRIDDTAYAQPALFALEYALAMLWRRCGVTADVVVGHSLGEIVAATVAGVMTLDDGLRLVAARGRLMQQLPRDGAMAAVVADYPTVDAAIADMRERVAVAAVNGPANIVISGARDAVTNVCARLHAAGVKHVPLAVSHAFHSPLMEPMLEALEAVASGIRYGAPEAVLLSNVSGGRCQQLDGAYWRRHAREAVQFLANARQLEQEGVEVAIELGPATLGSMVERALPQQRLTTVASIRRGHDEWQTLCEAAARLDAAGVRIDWTVFAGDAATPRVEVPPSPFRRQRFWISAGAPSTDHRIRPESGSALAGASVALASRPSVTVSEQIVSLEKFPFLADHRVRGMVVVPATAYIELVAAAVTERSGWRPIAFDEMAFTSAMLLEPAAERVVQVTLEGSADELRFTVHSRPRAVRSAEWNEHATGRVRRLADSAGADARDRMAAARGRCAEPLDREWMYARLAESGNQFGPAFQGVRTLCLGAGAAYAVVEPAAGVGDALQEYLFHPAVADSFGHALVAAALGTQEQWIGEVVGSHAREIRLYRPLRADSFEVFATLTSSAGTTDVINGNVLVTDAAGELVAETRDITMQVLGDRAGTAPTDDWWYRIEWEPNSPAPSGPVAGPLVVVSADVVAAELLSQSVDAPLTSVERIDRDDAGAPVPMARDRAEAVVARLRQAGREGGHIIYLCANNPADFGSVDAFEASVLGDCGSVLHLAQALAEAPPSTGRLWVVTRQAAQVAREPVATAQAPLWGLGRCLATDCGAAWGGLIDVDATMSPETLAGELSRVLSASGPERQVAVRGGWFVPRLARCRPTRAPAPLVPHPNGAYLVTGGLGGLGLEVADWLVRRGVRHLTLVGRRALPAREAWDDPALSEEARAAITAIRAFEHAGATVRVTAADVGDAGDVARLLEACSADGLPLRAIFHAAGVTEHSQLSRQNLDGFRRTFAGKLRGGWLLERLCPEAELVLFSSGSAVFGPPYLGAYAAANAFLDGLALQASALGRRRRVVSVNWGAWAHVGMAARAEGRDGRGSDLTRAMTPAQGIAALEHVLACDIPSLAVVPIDWAKWHQHGATGQPFFSRFVAASASAAVEASPPAPVAPRPPSSAGLSDDQEDLLEEFARVMELPASGFDLDEPLIALGVDSLMAVELRTAIERSYGVSIALDHLLGGATARQILEQVALKAPAGETAAARTTLVAEEEGQI